MTVRINKSAFNIREKLSELERPIGLKGSELMRAETAQEARDLVSAGRKNLVINGDMRIDQRSAGASTTPSTTSFTSVDRWKAVINPYSTFSMQRKSDGTVPGLPYYLRLTTVSATTNPVYELVWQPIEALDMFDQTAFGYSGAKDLSLSFWVRSSIPGPFSGSLENYLQNRAFVWEVNIDNANTWEYKTVNIPGDISGGWGTSTASTGAFLMFSLGTSYQGVADGKWASSQQLGSTTEIKRIQTLGATLDLTGVQLEVGKNATEFEHRSYGEELALCQRYYYQTPSHYHFLHKNGYYESQLFYFPTTMRAVPNVTTPTAVIRALNGTSNVSYTGFYTGRFTDGFYVGSSTTNNNSFHTFVFNGVITADAEL